MSVIEIDKHGSQSFTIWFWRLERKDKTKYHSKSISFGWYRKIWKKNKVNPMYKITNNGAKRKSKDCCFDMNIYIGYLIIGYTNWSFNSK